MATEDVPRMEEERTKAKTLMLRTTDDEVTEVGSPSTKAKNNEQKK